eukprot:CAMPEP_0181040600 /NCGR_PEP_ID=MMETSP1070-20121207/11134_1 /TAXON_ID=265543 /ORGANISM="Minutocellus polymorphus, Strain NH13" /LENGTH=133 /DNA_ID=CAMNT_0023118619 /DNA_START=87 /DNA_END=485 /DNA_ORIENTATION=+
MDQRPPAKSLPTIRAGPLPSLLFLNRRLPDPVSVSIFVSVGAAQHALHNSRCIFRYPLDVALDQIGLCPILLLVAKQSGETLGTVDADGLVAVDYRSGFGLGVQWGGGGCDRSAKGLMSVAMNGMQWCQSATW